MYAYRMGTGVMMLVVFAHAFMANRSRIHFVENFFDTVESLEKRKMKGEIKRHVKYIFSYSLRLILVVIVGIFVIGDLFFQEMLFGSLGFFIVIMTSWTRILPNIIMANIQILLASWLKFIQKMYEVNNLDLRRLLQNYEKIYCCLEEPLENVLETHKRLLICLKDLNNIYSFQVFLFTVYSYNNLLCNVYFLVETAMVHTGTLRHELLAVYAKNCIQSTFSLYLVTCHVANLMKEVSI